MGARLYSIAKHGRAFFSFGLIQANQILLPLLALPWLARVLGPDAFGLLMYMCLIPPLVALFMDWGLAPGGGRRAARLRGQNESLGELLGAALVAKLLLGSACVLICAALLPVLPHASDYPLAYAGAVCAGMARGLNPVWFFQGAGFGMPLVAAFDTISSCFALALVFIFIRSPDSWPLYLLFLPLAKGLAYGWLTFGLCRRFRPVFSYRAAKELLRATSALFGASFALMLCYNGGQLVLGAYLSASAMGAIGAANKILRAFASLINPFTQTLFPEICILAQKGARRATVILRWSLALTAICGVLCSALAWLATPFLIDLALGAGYGDAALALRIALCAAPLMFVNNALANQILIPFGQELAQMRTLAACAVLTAPLAAGLGYFYGLRGGAFLPVCIEALIAAGFCAAVIKKCPQALAGERGNFKRILR